MPSAAAHVLWTEPLGRRTDCNGSSTRPHAKAAADARWGKQREETLVCQLPLHAQPPAEVSYAVIIYRLLCSPQMAPFV